MIDLAQIPERIGRLVWHEDPRTLPAGWRGIVVLVRFACALYRELTQGYLTLQATSLVYTTLLSLVPLLAVSFSVLKGFGVHNQIEPLLLNALAPLGEVGVEITGKIIGFVDNMQVGILGSVGLAMLLYTVVSLIQKIEEAFNYTWRVGKSRPLAQRFSQYLSVLMVGPVLFFSAVGLTASVRGSAYVQGLMAVEPLGMLVAYASRLVPYLLITLAFAFVYVFVPNTRVRFRSAMVGALMAGALWQTLGWMFATFMVGSTHYTAIYSGLAILILFMIWIYIAWLILLIGASIAFYHQHPEYLAVRTREPRLSIRLRERLALLIGGQIARRHCRGDPPWSSEALSQALGIPNSTTQRILEVLEAGGFLVRTAGEPPCYLPARAAERIGVKDLLDQIRCFEEGAQDRAGAALDSGIAVLERRIEDAVTFALEAMTLKDLADSLDEATVPAAAESP